MKKIKTKTKKGVSSEEILKRVAKGLGTLNKLNFMERYAMFMGRAQLVELDLKHLAEKKGFTFDEMEKWTLGTTIKKLEAKGLRPDYVMHLEELLCYRNDMAHGFLVSDALGKSLIGARFQSLSDKQLRYALRSVEIVIQIRDALVKIKAKWFIPKSKIKKVLKAKEDQRLLHEQWFVGKVK